MKKNLLKLIFMTVIAAMAMPVTGAEGDLKFLGYSDELINEVKNITGIASVNNSNLTSEELEEADSVKEQLFELGTTRSLSPHLEDRSQEIRDEVLSYWQVMSPDANKSLPISQEIKETVAQNVEQALLANNFTVLQLDLLDLPEGSLHNKMRAVVRVSRQLKSKNSYNEIQANLKEVKNICNQAATIDGYCYLSELTTFVAENPKNNFYYEKTILTP